MHLLKITEQKQTDLKFVSMFTFGICVCHLDIRISDQNSNLLWLLNPPFKIYSECKNENRHFICSLS